MPRIYVKAKEPTFEKIKRRLFCELQIMSRAGIEPARPYGHRIFLPTTAFAADIRTIVCGLDYTFAFYYKIAFRQESSSLYTFIGIYEAEKI